MPALAWPVDLRVDVEVQGNKFQRVSAIEWVEVEDPEVVEVEPLRDTGEVLVSGKKEGSTLVLLYAEGKFGVWRVRVHPEGKALPAPVFFASPAAKACPGLKESPRSEDAALTALVKDEACRVALRGVLEKDGLLSRQLELTFELPALQSQLVDLQKGIDAVGAKGVQARYVGAGLVLTGNASPREHRKVLWELFRRSVGRVPLSDEVAPPGER